MSTFRNLTTTPEAVMQSLTLNIKTFPDIKIANEKSNLM